MPMNIAMLALTGTLLESAKFPHSLNHLILIGCGIARGISTHLHTQETQDLNVRFFCVDECVPPCIKGPLASEPFAELSEQNAPGQVCFHGSTSERNMPAVAIGRAEVGLRNAVAITPIVGRQKKAV